MREFHQLAKFLAFAMNAGMVLGVHLSDTEATQSPYLMPIALATGIVSIIALATSTAKEAN